MVQKVSQLCQKELPEEAQGVRQQAAFAEQSLLTRPLYGTEEERFRRESVE